MAKRTNRNLKSELEIDIEFIDGIIDYINRNDKTSALQLLKDWRWELVNIKEGIKKKFG